MAEIRVAKPARRGRAWLWLVPLVLLLGAGGWWFARERAEPVAARDTTVSAGVSTGVVDPATGTATGTPPSPAPMGDTAPGAPAAEPNAEATKKGAAGVAAPGPGPR